MRMRKGYGSHFVYLSLAVAYFVHASEVRYERVVHGIFKLSIMWRLLKTLRSPVMVSFADLHSLPRFPTSP